MNVSQSILNILYQYYLCRNYNKFLMRIESDCSINNRSRIKQPDKILIEFVTLHLSSPYLYLCNVVMKNLIKLLSYRRQ